jgi:hypothetical protein
MAISGCTKENTWQVGSPERKSLTEGDNKLCDKESNPTVQESRNKSEVGIQRRLNQLPHTRVVITESQQLAWKTVPRRMTSEASSIPDHGSSCTMGASRQRYYPGGDRLSVIPVVLHCPCSPARFPT